MELAKKEHQPFAWLTCTNQGVSQVCKAALDLEGVTEEEVDSGYFCDPTSKSDLGIVFKKGIIYRLTRNMDRARGYVNGALAEGIESLDGNKVFTARLLSSSNMVLVHPMEEEGQRFLPCCYGYATTIRRAQGCGFHHGCIYFDLKKYPAARGYGYVAVSRFVSRKGCYVYGKLRRTDFLPVGDEREDEVLERGWDSVTSSEDSEHGQQYVGKSALSGVEEDGMDSAAEVSDTGSEHIGINTLAEGISDDDMGLGLSAQESIDFV